MPHRWLPKQSCDTYRKLISNIGRENLVLLGCRRKGVLAVEYIQSCTDEVKYGCDEDGQSAVGQHHLVQFLHIRGGGETLHNILAGYIGGTGVKTCAHNQQKYAVLQYIGIKNRLVCRQEFTFAHGLENAPNPPFYAVGR